MARPCPPPRHSIPESIEELDAEHLAALAKVREAPHPTTHARGRVRQCLVNLRRLHLVALTGTSGFGGEYYRRRPEGTDVLVKRGLA